jgi:hypothetical protein
MTSRTNHCDLLTFERRVIIESSIFKPESYASIAIEGQRDSRSGNPGVPALLSYDALMDEISLDTSIMDTVWYLPTLLSK